MTPQRMLFALSVLVLLACQSEQNDSAPQTDQDSSGDTETDSSLVDSPDSDPSTDGPKDTEPPLDSESEDAAPMVDSDDEDSEEESDDPADSWNAMIEEAHGLFCFDERPTKLTHQESFVIEGYGGRSQIYLYPIEGHAVTAIIGTRSNNSFELFSEGETNETLFSVNAVREQQVAVGHFVSPNRLQFAWIVRNDEQTSLHISGFVSGEKEQIVELVDDVTQFTQETLAADLDGNGLDEILISGPFDTKIVRFDTVTQQYELEEHPELPRAENIAVVHFNSDSLADVITPQAVFLQTPSGDFEKADELGDTFDIGVVFSGDVDFDGDIDVLVWSENESKGEVYLSVDGALTLHQSIPPGFEMDYNEAGHLVDIDNDSDLDFILVTSLGLHVYLFSKDAGEYEYAGLWGTRQGDEDKCNRLRTTNGQHSLIVADLDDDSWPDVVALNPFPSEGGEAAKRTEIRIYR